jgi:hypothetical protein
MPSVLGYGAGLALILGTFDYTGGSLAGVFRDPNMDEVARKENLRKNRRRPLEEYIEDTGEGRGMLAPGLSGSSGRACLTRFKASMDLDMRTGDARRLLRSMGLISRTLNADKMSRLDLGICSAAFFKTCSDNQLQLRSCLLFVEYLLILVSTFMNLLYSGLTEYVFIHMLLKTWNEVALSFPANSRRKVRLMGCSIRNAG